MPATGPSCKTMPTETDQYKPTKTEFAKALAMLNILHEACKKWHERGAFVPILMGAAPEKIIWGVTGENVEQYFIANGKPCAHWVNQFSWWVTEWFDTQFCGEYLDQDEETCDLYIPQGETSDYLGVLLEKLAAYDGVFVELAGLTVLHGTVTYQQYLTALGRVDKDFEAFLTQD